VKTSRPDADWDAWAMQSAEEETSDGTRRRENKRAHVKRMIWWWMNVTNIRGGNAWFKDASSLPVDVTDFHSVVHKLGRKLIRGGLEESRQRTRFIFALRNAFTKHRQRSLAISEATFREHIPGYFHVDIGPRVTGDEAFEKVDRNGVDHSILRGCYLSPWACSILRDNALDGLMLDTTWMVIREYVTSILMGVYRNVGIPLGFAFSLGETTELYEQHYRAFADLFGLDLSQYILESDQGAALCAICAAKHQTQLFRLRHFFCL
jgi:hypothetical protein